MQAKEAMAGPEGQTISRLAVPFLSLAAFASASSLRVTDPQLPHLADEFHVPLGDAASVVTFFSVAYGVSQLFFGPLGDRYGKVFVVACACVACTITALLCALAPGFQLLLVARLLAGATAGAVIPLSMAWIGDVVPYQERQPVLARFLIGQILGVSAGVLAGGLAADRVSWRVPFFGIAALFAILSVALLSLNRRLPPHAKVLHRAEGAVLARMAREFRQVLATPWARFILLTVFLEGAFLYGAFAFIASHMFRTFGMSLSAAGALVMLFGLGGFAFAVVSRRLVGSLGETGLALRGGLLVGAAFLAIGLAKAWWWGIPACILAGLGFYMLHNTLQTNATQMAPERRGAAVAAFASCFFLGQSVGVAGAGLIVEREGTEAVMIAGAIGVTLLAIRFSARLRQKLR